MSLGILFNSEPTLIQPVGFSTQTQLGQAKVEFELLTNSVVTVATLALPLIEMEALVGSVTTRALLDQPIVSMEVQAVGFNTRAALANPVVEFELLPNSTATQTVIGLLELEMDVAAGSVFTESIVTSIDLELELIPNSIITRSIFNSIFIEQHFDLSFEDDLFTYSFTSLAMLTVQDLAFATLLDTLARLNRERELAVLAEFPVFPPDLQYEAHYIDGTTIIELVHSGAADGLSRAFEDTRLKINEFSDYLSLKEIALHIQMGRALTILANDFGLFAFNITHK